jgi:hypothetical protein
VRILIFASWRSLLRHFDSTVRLLVSEGHSVVVAIPDDGTRKQLQRSLAKAGVRLVRYQYARDPALASAVTTMRLVRDYMRYMKPPLLSAHANRRRVFELLVDEIGGDLSGQAEPTPLPSWLDDDEVISSLEHKLRDIESLVPSDSSIERVIEEERPDVVLVTPLVAAGSRQVEVVKAARALGIPCGLLVFSWDNLSNKGVIHEPPDRVFVWNGIQRAEAVELHGIDPSAVVVTGAPRFDSFFEMQPSTTRSEFCERYGLDPARPIITYVASAPAVTEREALIVDRWIAAVRNGPLSIREANVVIRPHPRQREVWVDWSGRTAPLIAVSPRPTVHGDQSLYDELYHSAAAVGLNTSAQIEAAIVGRPVYTFRADELAPGQEGSTHFSYLLTDRGGFVEHAATLDEHVEQLSRGVGGGFDVQTLTRFTESFVRPAGLDRPATPILAQGIIDLAGGGSTRFMPSRSTGRLLEPAIRLRDKSRRVAVGGRALRIRQALGTRARAAVFGLPPPKPSADTHVRDARSHLQALCDTDGPIVVGPWLGEVGYELLYWIPFVRWAARRHKSLKERMVVVSRGGTASWYGPLASRYVDVFDLMTTTELGTWRAGLLPERTVGFKQYDISPLDVELTRRARERLGVTEGPLLHPSLLYELLLPLAELGATPRLAKVAAYEPISAPSLDLDLPERFVAVRFYSSHFFPEAANTTEHVEAVLRALGDEWPLVDLDPNLDLDDHSAMRAAGVPLDLSSAMPSRNLEIQTAIIARAHAFVGTYGGLSYLPPMVGVPSICFYTESPDKYRRHLSLASELFANREWGDFVALDLGRPRSLEALAIALGAIARPGVPSG